MLTQRRTDDGCRVAVDTPLASAACTFPRGPMTVTPVSLSPSGSHRPKLPPAPDRRDPHVRAAGETAHTLPLGGRLCAETPAVFLTRTLLKLIHPPCRAGPLTVAVTRVRHS